MEIAFAATVTGPMERGIDCVVQMALAEGGRVIYESQKVVDKDGGIIGEHRSVINE